MIKNIYQDTIKENDYCINILKMFNIIYINKY